MSGDDRVIQQLAAEIDKLKRDVRRLKAREAPQIEFSDWTPTITQLGAVTITVNYARYIRLGDLVVVNINVETTAAGTTGNAIVIGGQPAAIQPAQLAGVFPVLGEALVENGTTRYVGAVYAVTATEWRVWDSGASGNAPLGTGFALASGDEISLFAAYEV